MTDFVAWDAIQDRAKRAILFNFQSVDCLAAAAPTGFGKTRLGANLMHYMNSKGCNWIWYTHRKTLLKQTADAFEERGLDFGLRASGYEDRVNLSKPGQIAMIQSEKSAITNKKPTRDYHDAKFVVIDEAHANKTGFSDKLIQYHLSQAAKVLLLTATPVGLSHAEKLINLSHLSEMREIEALLEAVPYTVPTQDMKHVKKVANGDYSATGQTQHYTSQQVLGNILEHYHRLQDKHFALMGGAPCLGFAPCVASSMTMTEQFCEAGVKAAHVDGEDVYLGEHDVDGERIVYRSDQKMRQYVFDEFEARRIKVIWNRFVMREGVDLPSIGHIIAATAVGTPETWVQMIGRGLRCHPSLTHIVIQDHGGNCNRVGLGDPNQDRDWELSDTNKSLVSASKEDRKADKEDLLKSCPNQKCARVFPTSKWKDNGYKCPACGKRSVKPVEIIIEQDGTLTKFYPKSTARKNIPECQAGFSKIYWAMRNSGHDPSFNQVAGAWKQQYPGYEICKETGRARNRETREVTELYYCPNKPDLWNLTIQQVGSTDMKWPNKGGD